MAWWTVAVKGCTWQRSGECSLPTAGLKMPLSPTMWPQLSLRGKSPICPASDQHTDMALTRGTALRLLDLKSSQCYLWICLLEAQGTAAESPRAWNPGWDRPFLLPPPRWALGHLLHLPESHQTEPPMASHSSVKQQVRNATTSGCRDREQAPCCL